MIRLKPTSPDMPSSIYISLWLSLDMVIYDLEMASLPERLGAESL